jgi:hypothetical protein
MIRRTPFQLKYLRIEAMYRVMPHFQRAMRRRRMEAFLRCMKPRPKARILDLGGTTRIWDLVSLPLELTIVNLPGQIEPRPSRHHVTYAEGDACDLPQFQRGDFDLVFSNSVIEHVGDEERQRAFAATVRRVAPAYWIQTPSKWFPVEPHTGMPFWWFYPTRLQEAILRGWRRKLPVWTRMVEGTRVLERAWFESLFPEAEVYVESLLGIPKSYTLFVPPA